RHEERVGQAVPDLTLAGQAEIPVAAVVVAAVADAAPVVREEPAVGPEAATAVLAEFQGEVKSAY
ncbi:MAG TPA: hypothetical protein VGD64_11825, partial [Acidisarcina sp.]